MKNWFVVTPFFLDKAMPELENLVHEGKNINTIHLPEGDQQIRMSILHEALAKHSMEIILRGERPVSIAGDCCTAIGVLAGLQRANLNPFLIWFDAHGDFNTWETTPSGFLGGMPLAMLVGRGDQSMPKAVSLHSLSEKQVILTDARDLDPGEKSLVEESAVQHLGDVRSLMNYSLPIGPLYIHFDTDIIDPDEAPAMSYPAPGGPTKEELKEVFQFLALTDQIVAVSMSSWNPSLDDNGHTAEVCMELLDLLIGV